MSAKVLDLSQADKKPRPHWSTFARGKRKERGTMNKLEKSYAAHLEGLKQLGQLEWFAYEAITLTLSRGCKGGAKGHRITVDFIVMLLSGTIELHEVKGHAEPRQINALKMAAELFPFKVLLVETRKKSDGGGWIFTEF